jgi:hypothetical protein
VKLAAPPVLVAGVTGPTALSVTENFSASTPSVNSAEVEFTHTRLTLVRQMHHICGARYHFGDDVFLFQDSRHGLDQLDDALVVRKATISWLVHDQHSCRFVAIKLDLQFEGNIRYAWHGAATQSDV